MMSSRALPEMEAEEAELLKAHQELHGNSSVNDNYVAVLSEIEEFNSLIDSLMQTKARAADLGLLHPKVGVMGLTRSTQHMGVGPRESWTVWAAL